MLSFLRSKLVHRLALILITFAIEPRPDHAHLPDNPVAKVVKLPGRTEHTAYPGKY